MARRVAGRTPPTGRRRGTGRALASALAVAAALAGWVSGCAAAAPAAPDLGGQWVGTLVTVAGRCPTDQPSDLRVTAGEVMFVPGDGVLVLRGRRDPADPDRLHAQLLGSDAAHKPLPMVFEGGPEARVPGAPLVIRGTYGTPACRATIAMRRPERGLLARIRGT